MVDSLHLGDIIDETGGLGRFQILIYVLIECFALSHAWSLLFMSYGSATPDFVCRNGRNETIKWSNATDHCKMADDSACDAWIFSEDMRTVVSEFSLVCDRKWFTMTITTVQMCGMLVGSVFWGHICDAIGRKYTLFLGLGLDSLSNLISIFSVNWEMFAALRFMIGFSVAAISASTVIFEFIHNKWRFWLGVVPVYSIWAGLMALFCWQVNDWRYICAVASGVSALAFTGYRLIPESYRWLVARGRFGEAEDVIRRMARTNGKPIPDLDKLKKRMQEDSDFLAHQRSIHIYTAVDLFRSWKLFKMTMLFAIIWLAGMFSYFGIQFDVPQLSGNLYLNMFLVAVADVPSSLCVAILNLKLGRKWTSVGMYVLGGLLCVIVGVFQRIGSENFHSAIVGLVIVAKFASNSGWVATAVWTLESYPTVIRHIGRGFVDCLSRIGAILAPQFITLSLDIPGLLYFVSGGLLVISAVACVFLEETRDKDLEDILPPKHTAGDQKQIQLGKL